MAFDSEQLRSLRTRFNNLFEDPSGQRKLRETARQNPAVRLCQNSLMVPKYNRSSYTIKDKQSNDCSNRSVNDALTIR